MIAETSLLFLGVAAFAVFFVGVAKAGFGGMIGALAMPMVAAVSDIVTAIAVLLPTYVAIDLVVAWLYRREVRWDILVPMATAGVLGVAVGGIAFQALDPRILQVMLGCLSIWGAVQFALRRRRTGPLPPLPDPRNWPRALGWGGTSGALSYVLAADAPAQFYLLPFRLAPAMHVAILVWFFAVVNWAKLPVMVGLGYITLDTLKLSVLFVPVMPLGIWVGKRINDRIPKEPFYIIVHILLLVLGVYLIATAALSGGAT